ncbi:hypothetical protein [Paludisphaera soli]|uniref:hypothetical protein n=1 Tax=Paludisphaera soli TaxID=2712865 RepID=UPI0013EC7AD3|nr:hypothetical protein [Paludisphaera soli]
MQRFSEFSLSSGFEGLEQRLSLSLVTSVSLSRTRLVSEDPVVPDPDPDLPSDPPPPPESDPGDFPGYPPPPVFPPPPIGGPVGPG